MSVLFPRSNRGKLFKFDRFADDFVIIVHDDGPGIDNWQVCLKQDDSRDRDHVITVESEEVAQELAYDIKVSISLALEQGYNAGLAKAKEAFKDSLDILNGIS